MKNVEKATRGTQLQRTAASPSKRLLSLQSLNEDYEPSKRLEFEITEDVPVKSSLPASEILSPALLGGNMALSSCPGKKVRLDSPYAGKAIISRDLRMDLERIAAQRVSLIICCLDNQELEFLGSPWEKYQKIATELDLKVLRLPIVEGGSPLSCLVLDNLLQKVDDLVGNAGNILCHCRGGIGRAGLVASCWLLKKKYFKSADEVVSHLRKRRSKKAIETEDQMDFIRQYHYFLLETSKTKRL